MTNNPTEAWFRLLSETPEAELEELYDEMMQLFAGVMRDARERGVRTPRVLHLAEAITGAADLILTEVARRRMGREVAAETYVESVEGQRNLDAVLAEILGG